MPNADPTVATTVFLAAFAIIAASSFLVSFLLTDVAHVRRSVYVGALALATGVLTWGYLWASGTGADEFLWTAPWWGLAAAALSGALTGRQARRWPGTGRPPRSVLTLRIAWEGFVYGATEGMLLSVLPVLALWQGGDAAGWTGTWPGRVGVGALALAGSLAVIAIHHLGYREFRGPIMRYPVAACGLFSLAYLLTGSVLAPIGGHIVLHVVATVRGTELPPHIAAVGRSPIAIGVGPRVPAASRG
jgi:hypothetical protein